MTPPVGQGATLSGSSVMGIGGRNRLGNEPA